MSCDATPLYGNVAPTFTSALVTPGVSARAGAPRIVAPIAAASMDFLNIDIPLSGDGLRRSSFVEFPYGLGDRLQAWLRPIPCSASLSPPLPRRTASRPPDRAPTLAACDG